MKKILFSAALALVFVSCSRDEVVEVNRDGDEIQFNVVSDAATRATDVYCNNNMPTEFRVWANAYVPNATEGAPYIIGDVIAREGNAPYTWKNTSGLRYWPAGELEFYAEVNAGDNFFWNDGRPEILDYEVPVEVSLQKDLLYASTRATKEDGAVKLNFRHALSQIVFDAKNMNPNLYVEIKGVTICNLANVGTLKLGADPGTDGNFENHLGSENTTQPDRNGWKKEHSSAMELTGGDMDYSVTFAPVPVPGNGATKQLTSQKDGVVANTKEYCTKAMLLLPQTTTAWAPAAGNGKPGAATQTGTYFLVDCKIYNVSDASKGYQSTYEGDVCLWDKPVAIPAAFNWKEGKKYKYTFVFGNENGGFNPDPVPDPDPEPVLTPITFEVTVDDFVYVGNKDYDMEAKN